MTVGKTIPNLTVVKDTYHAYVPSFVGELDRSDAVLAVGLVLALMAVRAMYRYSLVHMVSDGVPLPHPFARNFHRLRLGIVTPGSWLAMPTRVRCATVLTDTSKFADSPSSTA
jgi:hypothetical protein